MPLLAADSLPPLPPLYNPDPRLGPITKFRVLGYTFTWESIAKWADDHGIKAHGNHINRRAVTLRAICRRLPPDCRRWSAVHTAGTLLTCVVVATNDTQDELNRAQDLEMIHAVQKVLDRDTPPKWYIPDLRY
jgi:hypothetical protein